MITRTKDKILLCQAAIALSERMQGPDCWSKPWGDLKPVLFGSFSLKGHLYSVQLIAKQVNGVPLHIRDIRRDGKKVNIWAIRKALRQLEETER